jgi:hypothetical protein
VDANHGVLRTLFRDALGADNVCDTSKAGFGLGDLVIAYGGLVMLIEIKTEKGKLTKAQEKCKLPQRLVRNKEDVEETVRVLKRWHRAICEFEMKQTPLNDYPDNRFDA